MELAFSCCAHARGKVAVHVGWHRSGSGGTDKKVGGVVWMASHCLNARRARPVTVALDRAQFLFQYFSNNLNLLQTL
jgi:hypothetical protein